MIIKTNLQIIQNNFKALIKFHNNCEISIYRSEISTKKIFVATILDN